MTRNSRKKIFYVYALLDTRKPGHFRYGHWVFKFEPFYVGKGQSDRYLQHFEQGNLSRNTPKNAKIKKIFRETGEYPLCCIKKKNLTEKQAFELEIKLISKIGRACNNGPLTNLTDGGDGQHGYVFTDSDRKKISEGLKNSVHRESRMEKIKTCWQNKSKEEIARSVRKKQLSEKRNRSLKSPEQIALEKKLRGEAISRAKAAKRALKTPQQLEAERQARSARVKKQWDKLSTTERKKICKTMSRVSKERNQSMRY